MLGCWQSDDWSEVGWMRLPGLQYGWKLAHHLPSAPQSFQPENSAPVSIGSLACISSKSSCESVVLGSCMVGALECGCGCWGLPAAWSGGLVFFFWFVFVVFRQLVLGQLQLELWRLSWYSRYLKEGTDDLGALKFSPLCPPPVNQEISNTSETIKGSNEIGIFR